MSVLSTLPRARQTLRNAQGRPSYFDEIFVCAGPQTLAETGDNSYNVLFGAEWCALIDYETSVRRLFRRVTGGWQEFTNDPRVPQAVFGQVAPDDERRISLAFDQAARVVAAYEQSGTVRVTRWDPIAQQYVQNVTFAGVNPCLLMDAEVQRYIPDSDVVLWYQKPGDMSRVYYRLQRDNYGIENERYQYEWPLILDRAQALFLRYQLLVSTVNGIPIEVGGSIAALVSNLYPYYRGELAVIAGKGKFIDGLYRESAFIREAFFAVTGQGRFIGGEYDMPVIIYGRNFGITGEGRFVGGLYRKVVTLYQRAFAITGEGRFVGGNYNEIAIRLERDLAITGNGRFTGGTYAAA